MLLCVVSRKCYLTAHISFELTTKYAWRCLKYTVVVVTELPLMYTQHPVLRRLVLDQSIQKPNDFVVVVVE